MAPHSHRQLTMELENNITGSVLVHLTQEDLGEIGVASVGHRLMILKNIYGIIVAQDLEIGPDHYVPPSKKPVSLYTNSNHLKRC